MAEGLTRKGHTVHIVTTDDDGDERLAVPLAEPVKLDGYRVWYFSPLDTFYRVSPQMTRWFAQHISEFDVVHIHSLWSYPAIPAAYFAKRESVPYILHPHNVFNSWGMKNRRPYTKQLSFRLIESRIAGNATFILYTAEKERAEAAELDIDTPSRVLPLGIDLTPFEASPSSIPILQRYPALQDRTVILFLSRIDRNKGLGLLLPAFSKLLQACPQAILLVVGDGDPVLIREYKEQTIKLNIVDSVIWAGFLVGPEKLAAFAAAHLFVLPSYTENFGIVVVEAMAGGLPVIVSEGVGIAPQITEAEAGLVVSLDSEALTTAMQKLVSSPELSQRMGHNGRHLARRVYSQEVMAENLLSVYEEAVVIKSNES